MFLYADDNKTRDLRRVQGHWVFLGGSTQIVKTCLRIFYALNVKWATSIWRLVLLCLVTQKAAQSWLLLRLLFYSVWFNLSIVSFQTPPPMYPAMHKMLYLQKTSSFHQFTLLNWHISCFVAETPIYKNPSICLLVEVCGYFTNVLC